MTRGRRATTSRLAAAVTMAVLSLALVGALPAGRARAAGPLGTCGSSPSKPCVVLVSVDGLEPKDVNPQQTPFLWALAQKAE